MSGIDRRAVVAGVVSAAGAASAERALAGPAAPAWTPEQFHRARRFAALPQGRIAYVERGRGPAALFIHGWPLNGYQWRHLIARLDPYRRCIAPDLMGLGYSEAPQDQSLAPSAQADMLLALLDRLGVDSVDLVANDSGITIAQLLAVREPTRVRSLLLTNGDVHTNSPPEFLRPALDAARKGELAAMFEAHLHDPGFAASPAGLGAICYEDPATLSRSSCEVYFGPLLKDQRRRWQGQQYGVQFEPNPLPAIEADLRRLQAPARIVWGAADPIFDVRWADWLDQRLPHSQGVDRLPTAKLFFPEERPDELARAAAALWQVRLRTKATA